MDDPNSARREYAALIQRLAGLRSDRLLRALAEVGSARIFWVNRRLTDALATNGLTDVGSLRREPHTREGSCLLHSDSYFLSALDASWSKNRTRASAMTGPPRTVVVTGGAAVMFCFDPQNQSENPKPPPNPIFGPKPNPTPGPNPPGGPQPPNGC
jgi:hypothetical protein